LVNDIAQARSAATNLGYPFVLKSQLTVGGRGKAGAIVKCKDQSELEPKFNELIHKEIKGELPRGILIEEMAAIEKELYVSLFLNRSKRCYSLIASSEGGVEIENTDNKVVIDLPIEGIDERTATETASKLDLRGKDSESFVDLVIKLSSLTSSCEAELAEINPAAILKNGSMVALDAKVIIDDNSLFRHPDLKKFEHITELEKQAELSGFSLVELGGNIAIIGNGAGLVMSTLDMVSDAGGNAGAFLDFGGRATTETIYEALRVISQIGHVEAILVNLFGGIVRTSLVAQAILDAYRNNIISVPVFARISGAESERAKEMLQNSKAKLYSTVDEAIKAAVSAVK
jgi:succinyl-CoA synthetase beta subunit